MTEAKLVVPTRDMQHSAMEKIHKERQKRKQNWSEQETMLLVQEYTERAAVLSSTFFASPGCASRKRREAWAAITARLHKAFPATNRTVKECQKRWQSLQAAAKARIARYNEALCEADGGPPPSPPDVLDQLVIEITGKKNVTAMEYKSRCKIDAANMNHGTQDTSSENAVPARAPTTDQSEEEEELHEDFPLSTGLAGVSTLHTGLAGVSTLNTGPAGVPTLNNGARGVSTVPATGKTLPLADDGETIHLEKKRKLELEVLEAQLKMYDAQIRAFDAQVRAFNNQEIYYAKKNRLLDKGKNLL